MAHSINTVTLVGNITNDLELKKTNNGNSVMNFGLATNRSVKQSDGNYIDIAAFHNINVWNHLADFCSQYLSKGDKIAVVGRLEYDKWEKDGVKHERAKIVASQLVPMSRRNDGNGATEQQTREALGANNNDFDPQEDVSDDVPF